MKKWLLLTVILCAISSNGQELSLPITNFNFKEMKPSLFEKEDSIFENFSFEKEVKQSMLLMDNNRYNNLRTKFEFDKPSDLKIIKKIDYQQMFFGCPPTNSKDMMISSVKNYLLNKYVFSLFMNNVYE